MTNSQQILVTALPNGISEGGDFRVSVLLSPRLRSTVGDMQTLGKWPSFVDFPDLVSRMKFTVEFYDYQLKKAFLPTTSVAQPDVLRSDLWKKLFPGTTPVKPYRFQNHMRGLNDGNVMSYASKDVLNHLVTSYREVATEAQVPALAKVRQVYEPYEVIAAVSERYGIASEVSWILDRWENGDSLQRSPDATRDLTRLALFNAPTLRPLQQALAARRARQGVSSAINKLDTYFNVGAPPPIVKPPALDFHEGVAALSNHPQLLRMLGLVVDLTFRVPDELATESMRRGNLRVLMKFRQSTGFTPPRLAGTARLSTTTRLSTLGTFEAEPGPNQDTQAGVLKLNAVDGDVRRFDLIQVDLDSAGLKTLQFANQIARGQNPRRRGVGESRQEAPPTFRSAGMQIVQANRGYRVDQRLAKQQELAAKIDNPDEQVTLNAEDLTRGYVIDAFDAKSSTWYSLCSRVGTASFTAGTTPTTVELAAEDGWVSTGLTRGKAIGDKTVRVSETIAQWAHSWSLVAPRPGKTLNPDETEQTDWTGAARASNLPLEVDYRVTPGSLPPQRYGRSYGLRARAVDLAGNAIAPGAASESGFTHALGPEPLLRYEPVVPPTVMCRKPVTEAESTDRLVIRTNYDLVDVTDTSERHVFPPSIDQVGAELHGMFDTATGVDPAAYATIVAREGRTLDEAPSNVAAQPDPRNHGAPYFDVNEPLWTAESGTDARLPGLPDPLAHSMALWAPPGQPLGQGAFADTKRYSFAPTAGSWPETRPRRIQIYESAGVVAPIEVGNMVRIGLPKGFELDLDLSCALAEPQVLNTMGCWQLLDATTQQALRAAAANGRHWAITPSRRLHLVNACRQPLVPTEFDNLTIVRKVGETFAKLQDGMTTSRHTTERFEVRAAMTDVVDHVLPEPFPPPPEQLELWQPYGALEYEEMAFQVKVPLEDPTANNGIVIAEHHELGTTRGYRDVVYTTISTSRHAEYFREQAEVVWDGTGGSVQVADAVVAGSEKVTNAWVLGGVPADSITYTRGVDYTFDYATGTITSIDLAGGAPRTGAKVFVRFIADPITRTSTEPGASGPVVRDIPSSARPDAPKPLYAIPSFKWTRSGSDTSDQVTRESVREGGALRVYLDRPWWSSGAGELLGVCLAASTPTVGQRRFVTQVGQDGIFGIANGLTTPARFPKPEDFSGWEVTGLGCSVAELPGTKVNVVGYEVFPDYARRLWYTDILLDPKGAYMPFVRLALCRYQPNSVNLGVNNDVRISRIALMDFVQLMNDRVATIAWDLLAGGPAITVSGVTYSRAKSVGGQKVHHVPTMITAELQKRRAGQESGSDEVNWVPADPAAQPVVLTSHFDAGMCTWSGSVPEPGDGRHRVVLREYDLQKSRTSTAGPGRLVYAEAIDIRGPGLLPNPD